MLSAAPLAGATESMANAIFLVAGREMRDVRFREAVVLVTQPRQGGPWGVIVYFTGDVDWIDEQLKRPAPMRGLRVYAGYSGWGAGQLQNELARGDWHVMPADAATVFDKEPALIWPDLIQRVTAKQTRRDEGGGLRDEESSPRTAGDTHHSSLITHHALSTSGASR